MFWDFLEIVYLFSHCERIQILPMSAMQFFLVFCHSDNPLMSHPLASLKIDAQGQVKGLPEIRLIKQKEDCHFYNPQELLQGYLFLPAMPLSSKDCRISYLPAMGSENCCEV